jgi:hypothetical protein
MRRQSVQNINLEHPDFVAKKAMWSKYRDLYVGGEQLKANAATYLTPRQKEPGQVYEERLSKVFYENYVGSIIDWYAATLFRREPLIHIEGVNEVGRKFFNAFAEDCDLKGSALSDLFRRLMVDALVYGAGYVLADFPKVSRPIETRAEEEAYGASRAYLVECSPDSIINWSLDERGNYEWVVIRNTSLTKATVESAEWREETRWLYYDKQQYRVYRLLKGGPAKSEPELIDQGFHGFAKQNRVPLFEVKVMDGLWLMNKAGLLQLEHFNKSNALSWALTLGLFAQPVIYSDRPFNQVVGESYYIQLAPGDRFGWTEPSGNVFQIAADNLSRLQEEIYRVCYMMTQSGGNSSGIQQSGLSKMRDFAITQEVLRAYGDVVKDGMKRVLRAIEAAREDSLEIDISGLDEFDIGDFSTELDDAVKLLALNIDSTTFKKQLFQRLAAKYLCDVRQDVKDRIAQEIEAGI